MIGIRVERQQREWEGEQSRDQLQGAGVLLTDNKNGSVTYKFELNFSARSLEKIKETLL